MSLTLTFAPAINARVSAENGKAKAKCRCSGPRPAAYAASATDSQRQLLIPRQRL